MKAVEQIRFQGAGLELVADVEGPAQGQPVLFLHGSGQTRQSWSKAMHLAALRGYRAYSIDLRGHGDSAWAPNGEYSLDWFAADLRSVVAQLEAAPVLVGASLGGLASLMVAATPPPAVRALVMVDITTRVEVEGAQEVVAFMDSANAGFASLEEAADAVAAYLPHRPRPKNTNGLLRNLRLRGGRYYWHWDPAFNDYGKLAAARAKAANKAEASPVETAARALRVPTLLIRGGRSRILSDKGAREFIEMVPHTEFVDIEGAHHMVAGDANDPFNEAVFGFIDRQFGDDLRLRAAG